MSTNYKMRCGKCKEQGGYFTRQAWGWGNADVIENTVFLMAHADCFDRYQSDEDEGFEIISEYDRRDENEEEMLRWIDNLQDSTTRAGSAFPRADEWQVAKDGDIRQWWELQKSGKTDEAERYRSVLSVRAERLLAQRQMQKHLEEQLYMDVQKRADECVAGGGHYWNTESFEMGIGTNGYSFDSKICTTCGLTETGAMIQ